MARYNTYDRRVQLGASRHRRRDAEFLQQSARWNGAIYLAGYAIECSLKALICFGEQKYNLKDTALFTKGGQKVDLHSLSHLRDATPESFRNALASANLKNAWTTITALWQKDELRYGHKLGNEKECKRFLKAVEELYPVILYYQEETL